MVCGQFLRLCRVSSLRNPYAFVVTQNKFMTSKIQVRLRTGWLHRRPMRVLTAAISEDSNKLDLEKLKVERQSVLSNKADEHEIIQLDSYFENEIHKSIKQIEKPDSIKSTTEKDKSEKEVMSHKEMLQLTRMKLPVVNKKTKGEKEITKRRKIEKSASKSGLPLFTKLEDNDTKLSQVLLVAKSRNKREKKDVILLEGKRLIRDAIAAGYIPHMIIFSRVEDLKDLEVPNGTEVYKTTYKNLSLWSDVITSPGVMGVFKTPAVENTEPSNDALPLTVVCDNVRDPGNMGSILRVAACVGCSKIVLTKGCVDLWEPKVLRAAAGAHFRLPIVKDLDWNDIDNHIKNDSFVMLADNNTDVEESLVKRPVPVIPYYAMDYSDLNAITLIIGGETEGLSLCSFKLASTYNGVRVNVPLSNSINSLNTGTALGIIMFEIKRQIFLVQQNNRIGMSNA